MDGANQDEVPKPVRTMDDIARLFMSGARDAASSRRSPPGSDAGDAQQVPPTNANGMSEPAAANPAAPEPARLRLPAVQLVISPLAGEAAWKALENAARHIAAEQGAGVALVGVHEGVMRLMRAGPARNGVLAVSRKSRADGTVDLQVARALFGLRENVELWLVALPFGPAMDPMLAGVRDWLLVCGTDTDSIVAGYRAIKNLVAGDPVEEPRTLRLFPACDDATHAAMIHARLRRAAGEFLKQDITLGGVTTKTPAAIETVAEFNVAHCAPAAWGSVGEFLQDLVGSEFAEDDARDFAPSQTGPAVIDLQRQPEAPRDEAVALFEKPVVPAMPESVIAAEIEADAVFEIASPSPAPVRSVPAERTSIPSEAPRPIPAQASPPPIAAIPPATPATQVIETTSLTLDSQWNVVLGSAGEISGGGGEVLEARPPRETHGAIVLDRAGKLHVWTMARDASSWAALWTWAREHRQILALTRRDRWIDAAADVQLHVVIPAESERVPVEGLPGMSWYRILPVRWGSRTGAAVVPI